MSTTGTIEIIAKFLAEALAPLQRYLSPEEVDGYFASLGFQFPTSVTAHPGPRNALQEASLVAGQLSSLADSLSLAIQMDDLPGILAQGSATLSKLAEMFSKLDNIGIEIRALANSFPGVPASAISAFAADLPRAILELALIEHFEFVAPDVTNVLAIAGIIDRHREIGDLADSASLPFEVKRLKLNRLAELLRDPTAYLQNLYGWGSPGFDGQFFFEQLYELAGHSGMPALLIPPANPGGFPSLDLLFFEFQVDSTTNPHSLRFELRIPSKENFRLDIPLERPGWRLEMSSDGKIDAGSVAQILPPGTVMLTSPSGMLTADLQAKVSITPVAPNTHILLVGQAGGTRLEAASISMQARAALQWDAGAGVAKTTPVLEFEIHGGRFDLRLENAGPLTALLPKNGILAALDVGVRWSDGRISLSGSSALRTMIPVKLSLGPVEVESIAVGLVPGSGAAIPIELSSTLHTALGPLTLLVDGIGLRIGFNFPEGGHGNLGPLDVKLGFKFPSGIGVALDAGPVNGGGFLVQVDEAEYAGALQIKILGIGAFAFGIYKRMPNGAPSFIALLGIRLPFPGIQLSWGFALTGVGGLVGINRRANTDLIRDRLTSGTAGNVLFTDDPVKNAPALLNDMSVLFPDEPDIFLIGPTLQLNWGYLLFLDVGVFIELPGPRKIFIVGSAHMLVGASTELALVYLRLDFIGGIDFTKELLFFDAALVNSNVLQILDITGGVALRVGYGASAYFLFSVGGFHSSFNPGALELPKLARAGASLSINVGADVWLKLQMYLAVTPNTLQLGANIEAGIKLGPISAHGWFKFDALIQFTPFYFQAEINSGFDIEVFGESLYGVRVEGTMTGPGPIVIHAHARAKLLFVPVSGSATIRLGKDTPSAVEPITDLVERLKGELTKPQNLRAEGDDTSVIINTHTKPGGELWLAPVGELIWEQKRAPLNRLMQRFEGVDLAVEQQLEITCTIETKPESDWFSFGTYTRVSEAEALNTARFTQEMSGVRVQAGDFVQGAQQEYEVTIDLWKIPERETIPRFSLQLYMFDALLGLARERSMLVAAQPGKPVVQIKPQVWNAYDANGRTIMSEVSPAQAFRVADINGGTALNAVDMPVSLQGVF